MPETHDGYIWSHWLEDGDTSRTKTITLLGTTTWTGVFAVETATKRGYATFITDVGIIQDLVAVNESTLPTEGKPVGVTFPYGFFSFNVTGLTPGQAATITITLPSSMPVGTQYWKCQAGLWQRIPVGDDDGDNVIKITLTDGWIGDADGIENGVINDPGGLGIPSPPSPVGGKATPINIPINKPELQTPWMWLITIIPLAATALSNLRKRNNKSDLGFEPFED